MIAEQLKVEDIDAATASLERLTAAINAAGAALDALGQRHGKVTIRVAGSIAVMDMSLAGAVTAENIKAMVQQGIADNSRSMG